MTGITFDDWAARAAFPNHVSMTGPNLCGAETRDRGVICDQPFGHEGQWHEATIDGVRVKWQGMQWRRLIGQANA